MPVSLRTCLLLAAFLGSTGVLSASVERTVHLWGDNYPKDQSFAEASDSHDVKTQDTHQSGGSSCARQNQRKSWYGNNCLVFKEAFNYLITTRKLTAE